MLSPHEMKPHDWPLADSDLRANEFRQVLERSQELGSSTAAATVAHPRTEHFIIPAINPRHHIPKRGIIGSSISWSGQAIGSGLRWVEQTCGDLSMIRMLL